MFSSAKKIEKLVKFIVKALTKAIKAIDKVIVIYDKAASYVPFLTGLKDKLNTVISDLENADKEEEEAEEETEEETEE